MLLFFYDRKVCHIPFHSGPNTILVAIAEMIAWTSVSVVGMDRCSSGVES